MFERILIANRGEIACRIARTCRKLGVEHVSVFSEADAGARHLDGAAAAVCIGPGPASESYLAIDRLIEAARSTGCTAIHPGYGFLSENAAFAHAVTAAGMVFIGPRAETIEAMGDKARSKALMRAAGVPVVPGSDEASEDLRRIAELADLAGYPVLLKPTGGGGGKGMVVVDAPAGIAAAAEATIRQARASFGDGRLLIERFVIGPRHIEIQVFGDAHGNVVHLFERECSLQRRHQKVVEEAPAANLPDAVRVAMRAAAVQGSRALAYQNAGTFEFIFSPESGEFFFLEVNTRLQVEHPVTEAITGLDLVEWQLRVAAGEPLPLAQERIVARGHAMEARICAEDPTQDFRPAPGKIGRVAWSEGLRVDAGVASGSSVPAYYDPMIAKLIAHGPDREAARLSLRHGLRDSTITGVTTNIGFLAALLDEPEVIASEADTGHIGRRLAALTAQASPEAATAVAAALRLPRGEPAGEGPRSPWYGQAPIDGGHDRRWLAPEAPLGRIALQHGDCEVRAALRARDHDEASLEVGGGIYGVHVQQTGEAGGIWRGNVGGRVWSAVTRGGTTDVLVDGWRETFADVDDEGDRHSGGQGAARAPLPGVVSVVAVSVGDTVRRGQILATVEAMKMENQVLASTDGTVVEMDCRPGMTVTSGQILVRIAAPEDGMT